MKKKIEHRRKHAAELELAEKFQNVELADPQKVAERKIREWIAANGI